MVNDAGDDLVTNLKNLEPALKALADVGPDLIPGLTFATAFPYGPAFADAVTRGDYINLFAIFDLTYPRLKRTLFLGTRWGDQDAKLIPAPGDPWFCATTRINPLGVGVQPPSPDTVMPQGLRPRAKRADAACHRAAGPDGATGERRPGEHRIADLRGAVPGAGADGAGDPQRIVTSA